MAQKTWYDQGRQRPIFKKQADLASGQYHPGPYTARETAAERLCRALQSDGPARMAVLYVFESIEEVQQIATDWLWSCNHERPNMGNGGMTLVQKLKLAT